MAVDGAAPGDGDVTQVMALRQGSVPLAGPLALRIQDVFVVLQVFASENRRSGTEAEGEVTLQMHGPRQVGAGWEEERPAAGRAAGFNCLVDGLRVQCVAITGRPEVLDIVSTRGGLRLVSHPADFVTRRDLVGRSQSIDVTRLFQAR